jgi:alkylated DNA repair dioxygenase AlkB
LIHDYITEEEETRLLAAVDASEWDTTLQRRVQHYGYRYSYKNRTVPTGEHAAPSALPLPQWCEFLTTRLQGRGPFEERPAQLIINEYMPGQGIARHTDAAVFGSPIVSLTLGSGCEMTFRKLACPEVFRVYLPRRSLLVMEGEARSDWTHEIPARITDPNPVGRGRLRRERRVSLTFRVMA